MILNKSNFQLLKNAASISPSILFRPEKQQTVISPSKKSMFRFFLPEEARPSEEFGVYDFQSFISALNILLNQSDQVEITLTPSQINLQSNNEEITLPRCHTDYIRSSWTDRQINIEPAISGVFRQEVQSRLFKAIAALQCDAISFQGQIDQHKLVAYTGTDASARAYTYTFIEDDKVTRNDITLGRYHAPISAADLKLLQGYNYNFAIARSGVIKFNHMATLEYYIALGVDREFRDY